MIHLYRSGVLAGTLALTLVLLSACGGGGTGGDPSPAGESLARREFPKTVTADMLEERPGSTAETTFQFTSPTNELPAGVQLTGADGRFFEVQILASSTPDTTGKRAVTLRTIVKSPLDYENPSDENRDNVYSFRLVGTYRGEQLTSEFAVAIGDQPDAVAIHGDTVNQLFGESITSIPDITGDGKPELGVSIPSGYGQASAYIVGSEFFDGITTNVRLDVSNLGNGGTRFLQTPSTLTPPSLVAPVIRNNLLSAVPYGSGAQLLLSDAQRQKMYLFTVSGVAEYTSLRGSIDPDAYPEAISYAFSSGTGQPEGRLIEDINGDGEPDIFVHMIDAPSGAARFGIMLGRPALTSGDRERAASFDVTLNSSTRTLGGLNALTVRLISDVSGDGLRDLAVTLPGFIPFVNSIDDGTAWLIKSQTWTGNTPMFIDLDSMPVTQGARFAQRKVFDFIETADLDGDGLKSLFLPTSATSGWLVDGDDLAAGAVLGGPQALPAQFESGGGLMVEAGDYDGDGVADFLAGAGSPFVRSIHPGGPMRAGFVSAPAPIPGSWIIDFRSNPAYAQVLQRRPVHLAASGMAAFGVASLDGINGVANGVSSTVGAIVILKDSDIANSVRQPSNGLRVPQPSN